MTKLRWVQILFKCSELKVYIAKQCYLFMNSDDKNNAVPKTEIKIWVIQLQHVFCKISTTLQIELVVVHSGSQICIAS